LATFIIYHKEQNKIEGYDTLAVLYSSVWQSGRRLTDQAGTLYFFPLNVTVASVVVLVLVKKQL